jgi:hypothetical protein
MTTATAYVTKPDDFLILEKYKKPDDTVIEGNFPVFISGVSLCCRNNTGEIEAFPIIIPQI